MKNLKVVLLAVLTAVGLAGCGECQHVDENRDHKCDKCDVVMSQCEDKDPKDHLCDWCGAKVSEHEAVAGSHNCGICGEKISEHKDENKDHNCDICGEKLSEHHAADGSHNCEYCGAKLSEHEAAEGSHNCAICGEKLSDCEAAPNSHYCATCGAKLTEHVDAMHDGACDICGEAMAVVHVDPGHDGTCDVCGAPVAVHHVDAGDGYCSCGKKIVLESAVLNVDAAKKAYGLGESFNPSGVKVMGTYTDEQVKEVPCTCSTPDMSTVGTKEITVTYLDKDGNEQKLYFNIDVSYWTEEDLEVMSVGSLAVKYALPLPYLPGMKVEYTVDEDLTLLSWNILKENATEDDFDEYWELMGDYYYEEIVDEGTEDEMTITYEMVEMIVPKGLAEMYGFVDCYAFSMVPSDNEGYRAFVYDEFFVFGLTENGDFKLFNREVSAFLDGMYMGNEYLADYTFPVIDGKIGKQTTDEFFYYLSMIPAIYFTELGYDYVFMPEFAGSGILYIDSYSTSYPFDENLDDYQIAAEFNFWGGSETEHDEFVENLTGLGFELVDEESDEYGSMYAFDDPYVGFVKYYVYNFSETFVTDTQGAEAAEYYKVDAGYAVELYYSAPSMSRYMNSYSEELDNVTDELISSGTLTVSGYFAKYGSDQDGLLGFYVGEEGATVSVEEAIELFDANVPVDYVLEMVGVDADSAGDTYTYLIYNNGEFAIEYDVYDDLVAGMFRVVNIFVWEGEEDMNTLAQKVAIAVSEGELPEIQSGNHYRQFNIEAGDSSGKTYVDVLTEYAEELSGLFEFGTISDDGGVYTIVGTDEISGFILTIDLADVEGRWVARFTLSDKPFVGGIKDAVDAVVVEIKANYELDVKADHIKAGLYIITINGSESETQDKYDTICLEAANEAIENALPYGYQVVQTPIWSEDNQCYVALATSKDGLITYTIFVDAVLDDEGNPDSSTISTIVEIYVQDASWKGTTAYDALIEIGRKVEQNLGAVAGFNSYADGSFGTDIFTFVEGAPIPASTTDVKDVIIPAMIEDILPGGAIAEGKLYQTETGLYVMYFLSANGAVTYEVYFTLGKDSETTVTYYGYVLAYPSAQGTLLDLASKYYSNMYTFTQGSVTCDYDELTNTYSILGLGLADVPDANVDSFVDQFKQIAEACAPCAYGMQQTTNPYDAGDGWTAINYTDNSGSFTYTFKYKVTSTGEGVNLIEVVLLVCETPAE